MSNTRNLYLPYGVTLSQNQRTKLAKAFKNREPITIRLSHSELTGPDELMLTKTQIGRIRRSLTSGKGVDIKISKTQIGKVVKKGGSLFSSLVAFPHRSVVFSFHRIKSTFSLLIRDTSRKSKKKT